MSRLTRFCVIAAVAVSMTAGTGCSSGDTRTSSPTTAVAQTSVDDLIPLAGALQHNAELVTAGYRVSFVVDGERSDDVMVGMVDWVAQSSEGTFAGIPFEWQVDSITFDGVPSNERTPTALIETARVIAALAAPSVDNPVILQSQGAIVDGTGVVDGVEVTVFEYQSRRFSVDGNGRLVRFEATLPVSGAGVDIVLSD